ncbi:MAG: iron ABC transporter permease, partial [Eubacteriales bacterium]|nr:iron ABC transporter permease [Eubacteriales bacterium]
AAMVGASAFAGALLAAALVYAVARGAGASRLALVLAGVALSMLFTAGVDALTTFWPDCLPASSHFKIGSAANATLRTVYPALALVPLCLIAAFALHRELDVLALGDETAQSLGANPKRLRAVFLLLACALAASAVSLMGLIGFVGLLAPHGARMWVGGENGRVLPLSAALGASFLTLCDLAARTLFAPFELPVGILLAALGAPFFLWLLVRRRAHD